MPTEQEKVTRKLRAILSADVKGYSLLMSDDEAFTVKTIKSYRALMSELVGHHTGRVVDALGDNLLAEFASVVDAVQCAVQIQKILKEKNEDLPEDKRLEFRIGVNIGDVIQDGDSLYGEGVNIAARIEGLADASGLCISRNAYNHIRNKLNYGYEYLGEHNVKNIKHPVRVYKVLMNPEHAGILIGDVPKPVTKKWVWATVVLAVIVITAVVWQVYQKMTKPEFKPAKIEEMAYPLPDRPSIAVLAFDNLSGDPNQEYFSDGLTEEIIAGLSKIPSLFVIARNSSFIYKGKPIKVQQVSEELGVRYILEGSVRKENDRVRITAQLIDAISGYHKWSKRYDRKMENIFELQDDIMRDVLIEMQVQLSEGVQVRVWSKNRKHIKFEAIEKIMQSRWHFFRMNPEGFTMSRQLAEEAIEIDPAAYGAYVMVAFNHLTDILMGRSKSPRESIALAEKFTQKALQLNDLFPMAYIAIGQIHLFKRQYEKAIAEGNKALALDPNGAEIHNHLGYFLHMSGKFEEAISLYEKAIRLSPYPPSFYYTRLGGAYGIAGRYEEAIEICRKGLKRNPKDLGARLELAAAYIWQGREEEAFAEANEIIRVYPKISLHGIKATSLYKDKDTLRRWIEALHKAGLPEHLTVKALQKPSIAVLPFDNLSDDPEQEYFSDGMTDELISDLAKINDIIVISRNSTFTYKGKNIKVQKIAEDLNVQYVLEGSVQRSGNKVRIRAQLIEGKTDHHIWSESYDGLIDDIFELQDEITGKIVAELAINLTSDEKKRVFDKGTDSIEAYDAFLKASNLTMRMDPDRYAEAIPWFEKAIELDPNYSRAYAALSETYWYGTFMGFQNKLGISYRNARIRRANYLQMAMMNPNSIAYRDAAFLYAYRRQTEKALDYARKAIALDHSDAKNNQTMAFILNYLGKYEEAIDFAKRSEKFDPDCYH